MLKYLQNSLSEPYLLLSQYKGLKKDFQDFFKLEYLDFYHCECCSERCAPKIIHDKDKLFFICEFGYFPLPKEIKQEDAERYKFCFDRLFLKLAEINEINLNPEPIRKTSYFIGSNVINNRKYNYFYLHKLNLKSLEQEIYYIKSFFADSYKNFIITPANLTLKESDIAFLNQHNSEIISMESILSNKFLIKPFEKAETEPILIINAEKRTIILDGVEIHFKKKLKPFKCIYELTLNPQEKISAQTISGYQPSNKYDNTYRESARKAKERLQEFLAEEFDKNHKDKSILENLISSFNDESKYRLNITKEKIKITGKF